MGRGLTGGAGLTVGRGVGRRRGWRAAHAAAGGVALLGVLSLAGPAGSAAAARAVRRPVVHPVVVTITLDRTRVSAGTAIRGRAVLTDTTRRPETVESCATDGWLAVGLRNRSIAFDPGFFLVACAPTVHLHRGRNRFPITVSTRYGACTQAPAGATSGEPRCLDHGPPPLPAGRYRTKVVVVGLRHVEVSKSVRVQLT